MSRKYYAERHGAKIEPLDLKTLKRLFLLKFEKLEEDFYFQEATGYACVDEGVVPGTWGTNPESYFFMNLRIHNLWPIPQNIDKYDEPVLFSIIEFLFDHVSKPLNLRYHSYNRCGWHSSIYNQAEGRLKYREEINGILKDYKSGYQLSESGEIMEIPPTGLEPVLAEVIKTVDPRNIDDRINAAKKKYLRYGALLDDKKDAIRTLADVLEFLRKEDIKLLKKDDAALFRIINCFDIRHHNREQQGAYEKEVWYDWMFYTFLSSINALLKLKSKYGLKT